MPARMASARWEGGLRAGKGSLALGSGAFEGQYSFASRFEDGTGTNPEELIAAAHAGCYSMALAAGLEGAGHAVTSVSTTATAHLEKEDGGFRVGHIDLVTEASVPGVDEGTFRRQAEEAKAGCPISKALAAVDIRLDARLTG